MKVAENLLFAVIATVIAGAVRRAALWKRMFPPSGRPERNPTDWEPLARPHFPELTQPQEARGLTYREGQAFGVELELTSPLGSPDDTGLVFGDERWTEVAHQIIETIERAASCPVDRTPRRYHEVADTQRWRVEFDRSSGWEVVSPKLSNREGFKELINVIRSLDCLIQSSWDLCLNHRTGLHVTLAWPRATKSDRERLNNLVRLLEPGLFNFVSPSRLYGSAAAEKYREGQNMYCRPLRRPSGTPMQGRGKKRSRRYCSVHSSRGTERNGHVEVRLHHGTTDWVSVVTWISLWMTILCRRDGRSPGVQQLTHVYPGGDVPVTRRQAENEDLLALADRTGIPLNIPLREALYRQRDRMLAEWEAVLPQRTASWRRWWPRHERHGHG